MTNEMFYLKPNSGAGICSFKCGQRGICTNLSSTENTSYAVESQFGTRMEWEAHASPIQVTSI